MLIGMKTTPVLALFTLLLGGATFAETQATTGFFPFSKGRYWLYDGIVKYVQGDEIKEKKITRWKSEVLDTVNGNDFQAALVKGSPQDLSWYKEGQKRDAVIFVLTKNGEFHEIRGREDATTTFAGIQANSKLPADLIDSGTLLFKTSMKEGQRFGDPEQTQHGDRYCWVVSSITTAKLDNPVRGVPNEKPFTAYSLTFRTTPDHTHLSFTTDLGITYYEYVHHGTPGNCTMRLVETGKDPLLMN